MARNIVKVISDRGKLYLTFPCRLSQEVYGVNQKKVSLNMEDSEDRQKVAWAIARGIQSDIDLNRFDSSLERYGVGKAKYKAIPKQFSEEPQLSLLELWDRWVEYKAKSLKVGTLVNYAQARRILAKCATTNALEIRECLLKLTSMHWAKKILGLLSACYKWAIKHGLATNNPYDGMVSDLPKVGYELGTEPNPFTEDEMEDILIAFWDSPRYGRYFNFVKFLFYTGCRPSEAIGLMWIDISFRDNTICFAGSITRPQGKVVVNKGSKTNKSRIFPMNSVLVEFLKKHHLANYDLKSGDAQLVFPAPKGVDVPINYNNFYRRAWDEIVDPMKAGTTPYCCRDTFISLQVAKGVPPAIVAQWCDTSVKMIEKHYLGKSNLKPV